MTNYITKHIQVIFKCVFKVILGYLVSGRKSTPDFAGLPWTFPDFTGLLLVFVEIMPDKVILDHKSHNWSILKIFIVCDFFALVYFSKKFKKKSKFSKLTKYEF